MPPAEPEDLVEDHTGDRGGQDDCDERRPVFGPEHLNGGVLRVLHREDDHDDRHRTPTINATLISRAPVDSGGLSTACRSAHPATVNRSCSQASTRTDTSLSRAATAAAC